MDADTTGPARRAGATALLLVSVLLLLGAVVAGWLQLQLLDTDTWVETSEEALDEPEVRSALSITLVDRAWDRTNPDERLAEALPPDLAPLAAPAASAARPAAYDAIERALGSGRLAGLWANANRAGHERLVDVVEGDAPVVQSTGGEVTVDLRALVEQVATRLGLGELPDGRAADRLQVSVPESQETANVIQALRTLDGLFITLALAGVAALALGLLLARGRRRRALGTWATGLVVAGLVVHAMVTVVGGWLPGVVATEPAWQDAAAAIYDVLTVQLSLSANALLIVGAVTLAATWLLGTSGAAASTRSWVAPSLRDHPRAAWLGWALVTYAMFAWLPALSSRSPEGTLLLVALSLAGFWALRRELVRQAPTAGAGTHRTPPTMPWTGAAGPGSLRRRIGALRATVPRREPAGPATTAPEPGAAAAPTTAELLADAPPADLDRLERLADLHGRGVLDDAEFEGARVQLLHRLRRTHADAAAPTATASTQPRAGDPQNLREGDASVPPPPDSPPRGG